MTNSVNQQKGFSLLETLVAFSILVLVLATVVQIFGKSAKSTRLSYEYNQAVIIAQSKLADVQHIETESSGTEKEKFNWHVRREPTELDNPNNVRQHFKLDRFIVTVNWEGLGKSRQIQLSTVKLVNQ